MVSASGERENKGHIPSESHLVKDYLLTLKRTKGKESLFAEGL